MLPIALLVLIGLIVGLRIVSAWDTEPELAERAPRGGSDSSQVHSKQTGTLEIPGSVALESITLPPLGPGQKYLLELEIRAEKPANSPGRATYFGYNLSCQLQDGTSQTISVGGTENLVNGNPVTLSAAALLPASEDAQYSCRALVANEYEGVASTGSKVPFITEWVATPVRADSEWVSVGDVLPAVVKPGESVDLYRGQVSIPRSGNEDLSVIVNVHSTTCTTVSGSNENGRPWCDERALDAGGSEAEYFLRLERAGDSTSCASEARHETHIDGLVHHYVASLANGLARDPRCRGDADLLVTVANGGPAPLVLHQQNTEILIVRYL